MSCVIFVKTVNILNEVNFVFLFIFWLQMVLGPVTAAKRKLWNNILWVLVSHEGGKEKDKQLTKTTVVW